MTADAQAQPVLAGAQVVLPCEDLDATVAFFAGLGFRLDEVHPADDPRVAVVSGAGLSVRLDRCATGDAGVLRLLTPGTSTGVLVAPNGTQVELVPPLPPLELPELAPAFLVTRTSDAGAWVTGRAGMRYRDLLPGRLGGRYIASHISIPAGGPVPDYVHYHRICFQLIYCRQGRVRVVYEDQGDPFVMEAGDCVLQPPEIRHRVLEASDGLEVVEVTLPAEHQTLADHDLALPTGRVLPSRDFGGQRFVRHVAATAAWAPAGEPGVEARDTGIAAATEGLADVRVLRATAAATITVQPHTELWFGFVLAGSARLDRDGNPVGDRLVPGDALAVPSGATAVLADPSPGLELLQVTVDP
jgi:quercetin dioxygenase-like cupin family protein